MQHSVDAVATFAAEVFGTLGCEQYEVREFDGKAAKVAE